MLANKGKNQGKWTATTLIILTGIILLIGLGIYRNRQPKNNEPNDKWLNPDLSSKPSTENYILNDSSINDSFNTKIIEDKSVNDSFNGNSLTLKLKNYTQNQFPLNLENGNKTQLFLTDYNEIQSDISTENYNWGLNGYESHLQKKIWSNPKILKQIDILYRDNTSIKFQTLLEQIEKKEKLINGQQHRNQGQKPGVEKPDKEETEKNNEKEDGKDTNTIPEPNTTPIPESNHAVGMMIVFSLFSMSRRIANMKNTKADKRNRKKAM